FLIAEQAAFPPLSRRSHREAHETCASQWLPTERRSQSVRNATSLTRSPPCEDASASPWSTRWDDVHAALPRGPPAAATAYDAVRIEEAARKARAPAVPALPAQARRGRPDSISRRT